MSVRCWLPRILAGTALAFLPAITAAQSPGRQLVYGVAFGGGSRSTSGQLTTPPASAPPVSSGRPVGTVDLGGGLQLINRVTLLGVSEFSAGGNVGPGGWSVAGIVGAARLKLTRLSWVEAGAGTLALRYQPPAQVSLNGTSYWSPTIEGAAGMNVFEGPEVTMSIFGRYAVATFNGLTIRSFSIQCGLLGRH